MNFSLLVILFAVLCAHPRFGAISTFLIGTRSFHCYPSNVLALTEELTSRRPLCTICCGQKDEIGDFLRFRNKGDVTRVDFDRLSFHSICKETLQFRRSRLVLF